MWSCYVKLCKPVEENLCRCHAETSHKQDIIVIWTHIEKSHELKLYNYIDITSERYVKLTYKATWKLKKLNSSNYKKKIHEKITNIEFLKLWGNYIKRYYIIRSLVSLAYFCNAKFQAWENHWMNNDIRWIFLFHCPLGSSYSYGTTWKMGGY